MTEARQTGHSAHDGEHDAAPDPEATTASTTGEATSGEPSSGASPAPSESRPTGKTTGLWGSRGDAADEPTSASDGPAPAGGTGGSDHSDDSDDSDDSDALADQEDRAYRKEVRKGLLIGLGSGLLVGLVIALLLGAFVWPGYLTGPGSPDDTAQQATAALANKDATALDTVSCHNRSGQATTQIPAQALQLIGRATSTGPTSQTLDNEARTPVDLVVSSGGQTQTLPTDLVLSVNDGSWCLNGLAQRQ